MTEFLDDHPGGREIIESNRSKDVTHIFNPRHPSNQLDAENLPTAVHHLGLVDVENATEEEKGELMLKVSDEEEQRVKREREAMEERGLGVVVNMKDFEVSRVKRSSQGANGRRDSQSQCCRELLWHTTLQLVTMSGVRP